MIFLGGKREEEKEELPRLTCPNLAQEEQTCISTLSTSALNNWVDFPHISQPTILG
ncbi:hypothetical protein HYU21_03655 [Candidatus Woesearchaeota archaeon]|nr:hypothetical protein [Candidatus Woesearchaeota archaeon]